MKEFFKSKFFYVITVLTLIAVIVPTVLVSMGLTPVLRSAVNSGSAQTAHRGFFFVYLLIR